MRIGIFDIETDGLLRDATTMWCAAVRCLESGDLKLYRCPNKLMDHLATFDVVVGHNVLLFDLPVLTKLTGRTLTGRVTDTCVLSRLLWPDRNLHPAGGSSLENWGNYLGFPKTAHTDWSQFSVEMMAYCANDVNLTGELYKHLMGLTLPLDAVELEMDTARIIGQQILNGFGFNGLSADALRAELVLESFKINEELQTLFPPKIIQLKTKTKEIPFNPGSRDMIAAAFVKKYGWKPKDFTATGKPQVDEAILEGLPYPEAKVLNRYLLVDKRLSQLSSWIEHAKDGQIHGSVNTGGTVSGRMSHSDPNMAQVPRCGSPFGSECRSLFKPTRKRWVQVGADASGLELRMFAHYLADWDAGAYATVVCTGDIHSHNQGMAGLTTRDQAKTFIYGLLYGAGDSKVGTIVGGSVHDGKRLKESFKKQVPAYAKLLQQLAYAFAKRGALRGLDGRPLPVRSEHSALNLLLQSAGAVVMKKALVILNDLLKPHAGRWALMANIHDEWQIECEPGVATVVGEAAVLAIEQAGKDLKLKCPLTGTYKIGENWAETH